MDTHRREKHSRPQGGLTPDQVAKLDRLAELARRDPNVLEAIRGRLDDATLLEITLLTNDELQTLADDLGIEND
jgi:hypothetical protein